MNFFHNSCRFFSFLNLLKFVSTIHNSVLAHRDFRRGHFKYSYFENVVYINWAYPHPDQDRAEQNCNISETALSITILKFLKTLFNTNYPQKPG